MKDEDKTKEQLIKELQDLRKQLAEMQGRAPAKQVLGIREQQGGPDVRYGKEVPYGAEEPWLPVETKLVTISVVIGIGALVVLAVLVNMFLLGGH